jgi:hypothetical protein
MPTTDAPEPETENEPNGPTETHLDPASQDLSSPEVSVPSRSRWVDYDTHELLQMISELEDERRFARLREGIWIAILVHLVLISTLTWIPKYVFNAPRIIDPFEAINKRKDLTYLDLPPDALRTVQPKVVIKPVPEKQPSIDKKTLEEMNKPRRRRPRRSLRHRPLRPRLFSLRRPFCPARSRRRRLKRRVRQRCPPGPALP